MISNPKYKEPYYTCHQDLVKIYINFVTRSEAEQFAKDFESKFSLPVIPKITEQTIWLGSNVDTGGRYYSLSLIFAVWELSKIIKLNELFDKKDT